MANMDKPPAPPQNRPERKKLSKTEQVLESPEYKRERLRDLTGIEDEQELFETFSRLRELFVKTGLDNLKYRRSTIEGRAETETELAILNLTSEDLLEYEETLKELRVFGFPEPISGSNYTTLVIDNRRDLEVLRLLSVFKNLDKIFEQRQRDEQMRVEAEAYAEKIKLEEEERNKWLIAQERVNAEKRLGEELENAKKEKILELKKKWDLEKAEFQAKRTAEKKRMNEVIDSVLSTIKPQVIDLEFEIENLKDPFVEVTKFHGFQPELPRERGKVQKPQTRTGEVRSFLDEVDPMELDEKIATYTDLWKNGDIIDLEEEPIKLPGGNVDLSIFPQKFIWKIDKKSEKKKCYEYDPTSKEIGREIGKKEREGYMLDLRELRHIRFAEEEKQKVQLPKSKEEVELEQKVLLTLNNLIVWLINDLTSQMRGNTMLRRIKENDADDLYQDAVLGVFYAIDNHDPEKAVDGKVIPYIMACMEGTIRRTYQAEVGINKQKDQIRFPEGPLQTRREIQKTERLLRSQFPSESDNTKMEALLAEALSKPEIGVLPAGSGVAELQKLREKLLMDYEEVAYEILDSEDIDVDTQVNQLAKLLYTEPAQELYVERMDLKEAINKVLASLTPREERVLRMRFFPQDVNPTQIYLTNYEGSHEFEGLSLEEVAVSFSVTKERIRQIEMKALRKLKHPSRSRSLSAYALT